jgi:hypothetical protein
MRRFLIPLLQATASLVAAEDLSLSELRVYSQNGEDGVLEKIFELIGTTNKYYVEFGVEDGTQCNTRYLREVYGWQGLMMDGSHANQTLNLQQEFIIAENIEELFQKYGVPEEFDLLSIDTDFNDFYIWHAIEHYKPRVVCIEHNGMFPPHLDRVVVYNPGYIWDGTDYNGTSILAMAILGEYKGYTLVYAEAAEVNLFFIRNDVLENSGVEFKNAGCVGAIWHPPKYSVPHDPYNRPWISARQFLGGDPAVGE